MDLKSLETDQELADEGAWVVYDAPVEGPPAEVKLRHHEYGPYKKYVARAASKSRHSIAKNPETAVTLTNQGIAKYLWIESRGIESGGRPIGNDEETKFEILQKFKALRDFINLEVDNLSNFQREETAADQADLKSGNEVAG